jgi:hypothetical protein
MSRACSRSPNVAPNALKKKLADVARLLLLIEATAGPPFGPGLILTNP